MAVSVPYGIYIHWVGGAYLLMVDYSAGGKIEDQKPETNYLDKIISCISKVIRHWLPVDGISNVMMRKQGQEHQGGAFPGIEDYPPLDSHERILTLLTDFH